MFATWAVTKTRGCLLYIGGFTKTTHYIGIIISQYKDPYQPITLMECHKGFERCSLGCLLNSLVNGCDDDDNGMVPFMSTLLLLKVTSRRWTYSTFENFDAPLLGDETSQHLQKLQSPENVNKQFPYVFMGT